MFHSVCVFRKDAITNIQIKPNSCHDERVKDAVFKGFLSRAKSICSAEYLAEEINFIKNVFVENGYKVHHLNKIVEDMNKNKQKNTKKEQKFTSLPWIPEISNKLKKVFKEAGCQIAFKSPTNLNSLLKTRNKPQLPNNSKPGVYYIPTGCNKGYTGETKKKVSTRVTEHDKAVFTGDIDNDALAAHKENCDCDVRWEQSKTIAIEPIWFRRKVREALEIRRLKTGPNEPEGLNQDMGNYVTTNIWNELFTKIK